jgi:hypothetical protein
MGSFIYFRSNVCGLRLRIRYGLSYDDFDVVYRKRLQQSPGLFFDLLRNLQSKLMLREDLLVVGKILNIILYIH